MLCIHLSQRKLPISGLNDLMVYLSVLDTFIYAHDGVTARSILNQVDLKSKNLAGIPDYIASESSHLNQSDQSSIGQSRTFTSFDQSATANSNSGLHFADVGVHNHREMIDKEVQTEIEQVITAADKKVRTEPENATKRNKASASVSSQDSGYSGSVILEQRESEIVEESDSFFTNPLFN